MYKRSEVEKAAFDYFKNDLAAQVWVDKYALRISEVEFAELSPGATILRIAKELARIEAKYPNPLRYETICSLLEGYKKFVFAGSPLYGIGNNYTLSTLGNCFVVDSPLDSYGGIFKSDQELAQLMKRRGGVGIDISTLRPYLSKVNNAATSSTGAVSFATRFSNTTREVAQEGRRGALMLSMDIDHPDIIKFITCKDDLTKVTGANISVKVTDAFMHSIEENTFYKNDETKNLANQLIWDTLIHQAWKSAEPGLLFWDRILQESPADSYKEFKTKTTNPCSELPLCPYDSCRLGAINVYGYVNHPFKSNAEFDFARLYSDTINYQRFMDDIIDLEDEKITAIMNKIAKDPEPDDIKKVELNLWKKIQEKLLLGRRTGLGQMGLADAGAALGMRYGEDEFINFGEMVAKVIALGSYTGSIQLAKERGAFPIWNIDTESKNPFINRILRELTDVGRPEVVRDYAIYGRRNIANLTIAPTGSISILAGISSGIEPIFSLSYIRKRKVTADNPKKKFQDKTGDWWEEYEMLHPKFEQWLKTTSTDLSLEEAKAISPYSKSSAHEIDPDTKLTLQSKIQPWVDHSISITYNLPETAMEDQINNLYFKAWKLGLKGLTVYRDGSRDGVLNIGNKKPIFVQYDAVKRPNPLEGESFHVKVRGELFTVIVGLLDHKPYEVFAYKGVGAVGKGQIVKKKSGSYTFALDSKEFEITDNLTDEQEAITRGYSFGLRHGGDVKFAVEQLRKTKGDLTSFSKAIARILSKYVENVDYSRDVCPNCGSSLASEGGCIVCHSCGYSKCL